MNIERAIRILAGSLVAFSLILFLWVGPLALLLAAFVALNLFQSAFTGFCPAEKIFARMGLPNAGCGANFSAGRSPSRRQESAT